MNGTEQKPMGEPTPEQVAHDFVELYYKTLHEDPSQLYRWVWGGGKWQSKGLLGGGGPCAVPGCAPAWRRRLLGRSAPTTCCRHGQWDTRGLRGRMLGSARPAAGRHNVVCADKAQWFPCLGCRGGSGCRAAARLCLAVAVAPACPAWAGAACDTH